MQCDAVRLYPAQLLVNLPRGHASDDPEAVDDDRTLPSVAQDDVHMRKQVVTRVHHQTRGREPIKDWHRILVQ